MIDKHPGEREAMPQVWNRAGAPSSLLRAGDAWRAGGQSVQEEEKSEERGAEGRRAGERTDEEGRKDVPTETLSEEAGR